MVVNIFHHLTESKRPLL